MWARRCSCGVLTAGIALGRVAPFAAATDMRAGDVPGTVLGPADRQDPAADEALMPTAGLPVSRSWDGTFTALGHLAGCWWGSAGPCSSYAPRPWAAAPAAGSAGGSPVGVPPDGRQVARCDGERCQDVGHLCLTRSGQTEPDAHELGLAFRCYLLQTAGGGVLEPRLELGVEAGFADDGQGVGGSGAVGAFEVPEVAPQRRHSRQRVVLR